MASATAPVLSEKSYIDFWAKGDLRPLNSEPKGFADGGRQRFASWLQNELGPLVPGLFQERPGDESPLPKMWVDPITGLPLPSPFETKDRNGQLVLLKRDPRLHAHLKAVAKDPYGTIAKLSDEQAARQRLRAFDYNEETHNRNPFVPGNATLTERSKMVIIDPEKAEVYRREALPLRFPFELGASRNLTGMGRIAKSNSNARAIIGRAEELLKMWVGEQLEQTKRQMEAAQMTMEKMAKQLGKDAGK